MAVIVQRGSRILHRTGCVTKSTSFNLSMASEEGRTTLDDIPGPRGVYDLPICGTALHFYPFTNVKVSNLPEVFHTLHRRYGKIVRFRTGLHQSVFLFDPEYIHAATLCEGKYPERICPPLIEVYHRRVPGKPQSIVHRADWHQTRSAVVKHLKPSTLANYLEGNESCANDLVTRIRRKGRNTFDPKDDITRYFADANIELTLNKHLGFSSGNANAESEFLLKCVAEIALIIGESIYTFPAFKYFRTPMYNRFESARTFVLEFCDQQVQEFRKDLARNNLFPKENLLRQMIEDNNVPPEYIIIMATTFIEVGIGMPTNALLWNLWLLGLNQRQQEALHREIIETVGDSSSVTAQKLSYMPYLKACVKESFRYVFPFVSGSMRIMPEDCEIGGYAIPKGTHVYFGHNTLSKSEEYFENPSLYMPERWLKGVNDPVKQRHMAICALPFGRGRRSCLGRKFAEQQMHVALIQILRNFKISVPDISSDIQPIYRTFAIPNKRMELTFTPR